MESKWKGRHMIVNPGTVKVKETPRKYMRLTEASKYYGTSVMESCRLCKVHYQKSWFY